MNLARAADELMAYALALPEAWEDHPWGERVAKVGKKVFLFCGKPHGQDETLGFSVKLPRSGIAALDRAECEPTGYGLGKSGWVSAQYQRGDTLPLELIKAWIDESYRAIAPKTLVKQLDGAAAAPAKNPAVRKKAAVSKMQSSTTRAKISTKAKPARSRRG